MGEVIRVSGGVSNFLEDAMMSQTFADVALCCSGGQRFLAHRLVLSAASPYLHKVLLAHGDISGQSEVITVILAEVEGNDLAAILGFLYTGSTAVPKGRLQAFSSTADALRITIPPLPLALVVPDNPNELMINHPNNEDCHSRAQEKMPIDLSTTRAALDNEDHRLNLKFKETSNLRQLLAPPPLKEFDESCDFMYSNPRPCYGQASNANNSLEDCYINLKRSCFSRENSTTYIPNRVIASPWSQLVQLYPSPKRIIKSSDEDGPVDVSSVDEHCLSLTHEGPISSLNVSTVGVRRISSPLNYDPTNRTPLDQPQDLPSHNSLTSDKSDERDNEPEFMGTTTVYPKILTSLLESSRSNSDNTVQSSLDPSIRGNNFFELDNKGESLDTVESTRSHDDNNNHPAKIGRKLSSKKSSYVCRVCGTTFVSWTSLKIHSKSHTGEKPFRCSDCGKEFSQLRNYKYHRSIHEGTGEFAATCPECGKSFNDRGYLGSHMKIHRNRKEYVCEECGKSFNQRVAYNMHVRIHTGLKPHRCEECGKAFSRKMLLKQHLRTHSGERPYQCHICHKAFADRSNMTLHIRLHSGLKPYECHICSKAFTKKHHLKTHLNYHTGTKPYSCPNCSLAFSQSSNMRTHYKKCSTKLLAEERNPLETKTSVFPALTPPLSDLESQTVVLSEKNS